MDRNSEPLPQSSDKPRLSLYRFNGCPWCERVRAAVDDLRVAVDERDIRSSNEDAAELRAATGKGRVPVLRVDHAESTEWIPESADIVRYLYRNYGNGRAPTFLASPNPQRLGLALAVALCLSSFVAPEVWRPWLMFACVVAWLLGSRAPLLRLLR